MGWMPEQRTTSVFIQATNNPYVRELHCLYCGIIIAQIVGEVANVIDNQGVAVSMLPALRTNMLQLMCPRSTCKRMYRVFV